VALEELMWHNDGHEITLRIIKSEISVLEVFCPHSGNPEGACQDQSYGCLVDWFLMRYGLECNVGSCAPEEKIKICWTLQGERRDIEACQVWFMPVTDDVFSAWLVSLGLPEASDSSDQKL
jgi:hypothetical protein